MQCEENHLILEAYFDGELEDEARLKTARHLESCAACASLLQQLKAERELYVGYEPQVEVKPELWAMVQSRIGEQRPPLSIGFFARLQTWLGSTFAAAPQVSLGATAALILLAVGLTVSLMMYLRPGAEKTNSSLPEPAAQGTAPAPPQTILKTESNEVQIPKNVVVNQSPKAASSRGKPELNAAKPASRRNTADQLVREAEQKYLTAIAMLTRTVDRRRSGLDAPTVARLEQSLARVDRSIADTRKAVQKHPADPVAVQYMLAAYSRKVDVLREIIGH